MQTHRMQRSKQRITERLRVPVAAQPTQQPATNPSATTTGDVAKDFGESGTTASHPDVDEVAEIRSS